jgi:Protein of unknown function (DUF1778)
MGKLICFRVDEEQKARIEAAANILNKSVTTFVKETVMSVVEKVESRPRKQTEHLNLFDTEGRPAPESPRAKQKKPSAAVPAWFRELCREAARGGSFGFHRVGYRWASNMPPDIPPGFTYSEWQEQVESIKNSLAIAALTTVDKKWRDALIESILAWFTRNFPSQMELIPSRRHREFAQGFLDAANDTMRMPSK